MLDIMSRISLNLHCFGLFLSLFRYMTSENIKNNPKRTGMAYTLAVFRKLSKFIFSSQKLFPLYSNRQSLPFPSIRHTAIISETAYKMQSFVNH
jgi:hypothetical protein